MPASIGNGHRDQSRGLSGHHLLQREAGERLFPACAFLRIVVFFVVFSSTHNARKFFQNVLVKFFTIWQSLASFGTLWPCRHGIGV
jgi:hypothetical protein